MDALELFQNVIVPSYTQAKQQGDFYSLQNVIISMNTMPEHVALERLGYPAGLSRNERRVHAQAVRVELGLEPVQTCADVLKHVRSNTDQGTLSSTGIDPNNRTTWKIGRHDLVQVADDGFATLKSLPELNQRGT
jgi:hypothetical protein